MNFGQQYLPGKGIDLVKKEEDIRLIVEDFFRLDKTDERQLSQSIIGVLGVENVDEQMLNFAIQQSAKKIRSLKGTGRIDPVELRRAINLIVDWALLKVKSQNNTSTDSSYNDIKIGSNQPNKSIIDSLL